MAIRDAKAYAAAIQRKLDAVPKILRERVKAAQGQNADELVQLARNLAPVRTGALVASIHKEQGPTDLQLRVKAGGGAAFYAPFVEFGTRSSAAGDLQGFTTKATLARGIEAQNRRRKAKRTHPGTKARPFFFPAYRALKKRMKSRLARAARNGIKDVAAASPGSSS